MTDEQLEKFKKEREQVNRAKELALRLGTILPGDTSVNMWPLPILEAIVKKLEELEKK